MRRRAFIALIGTTVAWPCAAIAQVLPRRALIAVLTGASSASAARIISGFLRGLNELGYVEGRDIEIVYRYGDGDLARMPMLADELVRLKPDVIVTGVTAAILAVKRATAAIPIVAPAMFDPVGLGFAESQNRPGGQVTGLLLTLESLPGKQLELILELVPGATKIGMLENISNPSHPVWRRAVEAAANAVRITLVPVEVRGPDDLVAAFQTFVHERVELVLVPGDGLFFSERRQIAELSAAARLPAMYAYREHVIDGGLISYGVDLPENYRRAAAYVVKILKGSKPGDLPIEFPTKLELIINLRTAKALALTVPATLRTLADEVIE